MRLILVGGGLANTLIAWRLSVLRPEVDWLMLEAGAELGGNHTWSFHAADLTADQQRWIAPFVSASWPDYAVRFPGLDRHMPLGYRSVGSERLRQASAGLMAGRLRTGTEVVALRPDGVTLRSGEVLAADGVIDGRGYRPSPHLRVAFQKFVGVEIRTASPHGQASPIVMDATVPQRDGFRFVYTLPFAPDRILVEDTYYSDRLELDVAATRALALDYAGRRGWSVAEIVREETGTLPIALGGDVAAFWADAGGVARSGLRAALFHPTTGYSLPDAVRLADRLAALPELSVASLFAATRAHSVACWRANGFYRLLDRLLFQAAEPDRRYRLLERFYRLSPGLVSRFYAGRSTWLDKARVLSGRPPVPIGKALGCLRDVAAERQTS